MHSKNLKANAAWGATEMGLLDSTKAEGDALTLSQVCYTAAGGRKTICMAGRIWPKRTFHFYPRKSTDFGTPSFGTLGWMPGE
jgi:hypothetical protein